MVPLPQTLEACTPVAPGFMLSLDEGETGAWFINGLCKSLYYVEAGQLPHYKEHQGLVAREYNLIREGTVVTHATFKNVTGGTTGIHTPIMHLDKCLFKSGYFVRNTEFPDKLHLMYGVFDRVCLGHVGKYELARVSLKPTMTRIIMRAQKQKAAPTHVTALPSVPSDH